MGAHYNAFTSEENTVYYAAVLPEYQTSAVELLADILRPSLREEDFNTEKQVIIEEIQMYEDQPPFGADDKCKAAHFGSHPLGRSVLGTVKSITDLPVEAMREYFERRYQPRQHHAGRRGTDRFRRTGRARPNESAAPGSPIGRAARRSAGRAASAAFSACTKKPPRRNTCCNWRNGPGATDADRYAAKMLATVLGDDSGSRLYWELVDRAWPSRPASAITTTRAPACS